MDSLVERIHHNVQITHDDIDRLFQGQDESFTTNMNQLNELFHVALEYQRLQVIQSILYYPCSIPIVLTVPTPVIDEYLASNTSDGIQILIYLAHHYQRRKSWVQLMITGRQIENMIQRRVSNEKIQEFLNIYLQCRDAHDHLFTRMDWDHSNTTGLELINTEYIDYMAPGYRASYYDEYIPVSWTIFEQWEILKHYMTDVPSVNHLLYCMVNEGLLSLVVDYTRGHTLDNQSMCMFLHVQLENLLFEFEAFFSDPREWSIEWFESLWNRSLCLTYLHDTQFEHNKVTKLMHPFSSEVGERMTILAEYFGKLCSVSKLLGALIW